MSEIELLRRMRGDQPADADALARARLRLMDEARGGSAAMTRAARPRPRFGWRLAIAGGLSLVLAAGVAFAVAGGSSEGEPPTGSAVRDAAWILRSAAVAARQEPELAARPDQFVYIETVQKGLTPKFTGTERMWRSVDGTRDGLVRWEPKAGAKTEEPVEGCATDSCTRYPGIKTTLPTDPEAMWQHLVTRAAADPVADEFTIAFWTVRRSYVTPASRAALFEAMSRIPGIAVAEGVTDAAGRAGVAVERDGFSLIFDPKTYAYLGDRTAAAEGSARVRTAIVDRSGELPQ
ncbi:CU044_5270 family protein [Phytohabitans aurantiacus]|uniref:Uncharacterized protein n=1 Tax=Phytohabitans aurantiacus TaxID=3016789 RepID=A0ABQ5QYN7_9ACTN|nr:CU044_5270 family protein [Phytohabitans aurantiacus]GLH99663.1 hypothetical protein Pa4123_49390 [Phytohabitans aurantiacus]